MRLKPINQQVVVLVGASSGIGRLTAIEFARRGAKVVVSARSDEGLDTLVDDMRREGREITAVTADVADFAQVKTIADTAVNLYGRIDTWVHLAAVILYARFEETTPEEFQQVIDVNLVGQAFGAMAALPHLRRAGRGALIHVTSIEGLRAMPFHSAYAASKHGVVGFLEALRLELRKEGAPISITNIMPGSINTPLFNKARTKLGVKPQGIPPIYEPEVVVETILHAAEHPSRDLFAGGSARMMAFIQALSPRLMDTLLLRTAFKGQKTDEAKSVAAPDSLYRPISGFNRIKGDFSAKASSLSPYTRAQLHPGLTTIITGLALGAGIALARRFTKNSGKATRGAPPYRP